MAEDRVREARAIAVTANVTKSADVALRQISYQTRLTRSRLLSALLDDLVARYQAEGIGALDSPAPLAEAVASVAAAGGVTAEAPIA